MRSVGARRRIVRTPEGTASFLRTVHECPRCRRSGAVLDKELGLPSGEKLDQRLMRRIAFSGGEEKSYEHARRAMRELTGIEVSKAEFQRSTQMVGERVDRWQKERDALRLAPVSPERPAPPPDFRPEILVTAADATTVPTLDGQENKSVNCGRAFDLADRVRKETAEGPFAPKSAEPAPEVPCAVPESEPPPPALPDSEPAAPSTSELGRPLVVRDLQIASSGNMEEFSLAFRAMCLRAGMRTAMLVAFLGDGARALWKMAAEVLPPGTIFIQDIWHVLEHLAHVCRKVFDEEPDKSPRMERWRKMLREGRVHELIVELKKEHAVRRGERREILRQEIQYLENGAHRMNYPEYEALGLPIGSGCIESTCKSVKHRFTAPGARWHRDKLQPLLAIRTALHNDDWGDFWNSPAALPDPSVLLN